MKTSLSQTEVEAQAEKLGLPKKSYNVQLKVERAVIERGYVAIEVEAYQKETAIEKARQTYLKNPERYEKDIFADEIVDEGAFTPSENQEEVEIEEEQEMVSPPSLVIPTASGKKKGLAGSA